ncbi:MAG: thioesterase family protein [Chitinophagaceae bacterium]|nr:thioesterase family protein [Chitinophagaceae bacterium]
MLRSPKKILATIKIPVRINDINYGNHLGNHSLVSILHEARMQWLSGGGFSELDIKGSGLIMTELAVEYKAESFYGDVLSIAISVADISRAAFDLYYQVSNQQGKLIAQAKTGMLSYHYEKKAIASLSEDFKIFLLQ